MTTLADVLTATKPPLELLDHLTRYQGRGALPDVVVTWLERWRRIYAGDPDPLLDGLPGSAGANLFDANVEGMTPLPFQPVDSPFAGQIEISTASGCKLHGDIEGKF